MPAHARTVQKDFALWSDLWVPHTTITLAHQFPALYSHSVNQSASVARVLASSDLNLDLAPRISHVATCELTNLCSLLASVNLNDQVTDRRISRLNDQLGLPGNLGGKTKGSLGPCYLEELRPEQMQNVRLAGQQGSNLHERTALPSKHCPLCGQCESINHMLFDCDLLRPLWEQLTSLQAERPSSLTQLWQGELTNKTRPTVVMALLSNIWKRRNAKVFRNITQDNHFIAQATADDLILWPNRCQNTQKQNLLRDWASMLFHLAVRL